MSTPGPHGSATDPYRMFFPLGVLMGVGGVAVWPLYYWQVIHWYNGRLHAFVQTDCFLYAFIVGFLWTAIPRFTGTDAPSLAVQVVLALLIAAQAVAFELRLFPAGHVLFVVSHTIVIAVAARCFAQRRHPPPETFSLVGIGLLSGLLAALINAAIALEWISPNLDLVGRRLMTEGMVLLLVLGVGGFLGPRLLGFAQLPNFQALEEIGPRPNLFLAMGWRRVFYAIAGLTIIVALIFEYGAEVTWLGWVRAALVTSLVLINIHPYRLPATRTTLSWCVWIAHWFLIAGIWSIVIFPKYRVDFLHLIFMGAFTLLVLAVGTRVVLSHGGYGLAAESRSWPLRIGIVTGLIAVLSRVAAGFLPSTYFAHLAWAAVFWIIGIVFWGIFVLRRIAAH